MEVEYSIRHFDKEYQQLCKEKMLLYSPSFLYDILSCVKSISSILMNPFLSAFEPLLTNIACHSMMLRNRRRRIINKWRKRRLPSCNTSDLSFSSFGNDRIELVIDHKKYTFHAYELQQ